MKNLLTDKYINNKTKEYSSIVKDALEIGIQFLPPDINKSDYPFTIEGGKLRIGLCAIKGLGEKAAGYLLEKRATDIQSFNHLLSLVEKKSFNKTKIFIAIFSGLLDPFGISRYELYKLYCDKYLERQPEEEISLAKDFKIKTKTRAVKGLQEQFFGAVYF